MIRKIILIAMIALLMGSAFAARCTAITKKGTQCKRNATQGEYCWQHGKMYGSRSSEQKQVEKEKQDVKQSEKQSHGRCQATTKKGMQCKRKATKDGFCWQHGKK